MNAKFRPTRLGPRVAELADLFRSATLGSVPDHVEDHFLDHFVGKVEGPLVGPFVLPNVEYTVDVGEDKWADKRPFYLADEMVEKVVFNVIG
jgi:hypothetical protein